MKYSKILTNTPQTSPVAGRTDMVKNNAGGYVFKVKPEVLLERFLLIGSEGGTYYVGESKLTLDNAQGIIQMIKESGEAVVKTVVAFAKERRAPKADPGIFVLGLCLTYGEGPARIAAYEAIRHVCQNSTHLFLLVATIKDLRGWSRGLRKAIAKFYLSKTPDQLAYQLVKYRNRNGFTHRDVLRLAHPKTKDTKINNLLSYAVGKTPAHLLSSKLINSFENVQYPEVTIDALVANIHEGRLTWEMVPTEALNHKRVLTALLENMPLVALVRNLNRFAIAGLTDGPTEVTRAIIAKLTDKDLIKKTAMHPVNVVNAMLTYGQGYGFRGGKTWTPNQRIVDALAELYHESTTILAPIKKTILMGVDNSGSMMHTINNSAMSANTFSNVLALTVLKSAPNAETIAFSTKMSEFKLGRRSSLDEALKLPATGGGTDCAVPIVYALEKKIKYDVILILTDNETWAGQRHGIQALEYYRRNINPNVKVIEVASVATGYSQFPSDDPNILRIVGFDASVLTLIYDFLK